MAGLAGCVSEQALPGPPVMAPVWTGDAFLMPDGARLPYRVWQTQGPPKAVALALHGFNDSRNAWEIPAPELAEAGIAVYAPDQRGFGAAPGRGLWPGADALVNDAGAMARLLRQAYPDTRLVMIGESMGGAVLMRLATEQSVPVDGYVLSAPAVWGRTRMNWAMQGGLWVSSHVLPGLAVSRAPVEVRPSDNIEALRRLSRDPLTIHATRFDTLHGLVDLMDQALAAAPHFQAPGLFLYGAHDDLVPAKATAAMWQALPPAATRAFYPDGYHLLLRDLGRGAVLRDIVAWVKEAHPPQGALTAADRFLAAQHLEG
jgi:alpha-beta hydrolase superfamily lysophospholipase